MKYISTAVFIMYLVFPTPLIGQLDIIWESSFGNLQGDGLLSAVLTLDEGLIGTGYHSSRTDFGSCVDDDEKEYWVLKLNQDLRFDWELIFSSTDGIQFSEPVSKSDDITSIIQTSDGGYACTTFTCINASTYLNNRVIKLAADGTVEWNRRYYWQGATTLNKIIETSDNQYLVLGKNAGVIDRFGDLLVYKIDKDGEMLWERLLSRPGIEHIGDMLLLPDGNIVILGTSISQCDRVDPTAYHGMDIWLVCLDSVGNVNWEKHYGGSSFDGGNAICIANDGGFVIAGTTASPEYNTTLSMSRTDIWILKVDRQGELIWQKSFGGTFRHHLLCDKLLVTSSNYLPACQ